MQSFDFAHGVAQTLPTLRQPVDRTGGRCRVAFLRMVTSVRHSCVVSEEGKEGQKGHGIYMWPFFAIRITTKSKHCPQVASTSLHPEKVWEKHRATKKIARDPSACSGSVEAVAPRKLTYLLRANPLDASIWGA